MFMLLTALLACNGPSDETGDTDTGPAVPLDGFGAISGDCGVLDDEEWNSSAPFIFSNAIDFGEATFEDSLLSVGGQEIVADGNLNPGSLYSETFAFEVLYRCEIASLLATEAEIIYDDPDGKKTDLLTEIDGRNIGVSVTRAFHWPPEDPYTIDEGVDLLTDKLGDILISADNAADENDWERSILHVIAYDEQYADAIVQAHERLDAQAQAQIILIVTATSGSDDFIY
jgi:hypothetical protein